MTKILIADDHPLFLDGLATLLTTMLPSTTVYQAKDIFQVQTKLETVEVDLVLLDRMMPGMDGMKRLAELREKYPTLPIAIISASDSGQHIREAFDHGAIGFIPKTYDPKKTVDAVSQVLSGSIHIPKQIWHSKKSCVDKNITISSRQIEILECISQGQSNKLIADDLGIAEGTVKQHINNIYRSLNVTNRMLAVQRARDLGLLS